MSKSKKNVIDPEFIIKIMVQTLFVFLFCLIATGKDVQWSDQGMVSLHKFIQKLWTYTMK